MMHPAIHGFGRDAKAVKGKKLERDLVRRVLRLARPYRRQLIGFVVTVVLAAVISAVPPLILRAVIDTAIPEKDRALVGLLAVGAVFLALLNAGLTLVQRYYSARIGEGVISAVRSSRSTTERASSRWPEWTAASARLMMPANCSRSWWLGSVGSKTRRMAS